jgi:hypothetical protein
MVGKRAMKRSQWSAALAAWVCWDIASETRMAYGSVVRRNARGRPFAAYQARIALRAATGTLGDWGTSRRIAGVKGPVIAR